MDTLVKIDLTDPNDVKIKQELTSSFVKNFTKVELSITENNRIKKNIIPSSDLLNISGYFITRKDVVTLLAELADDLPISDSLSLKKALQEMLANPSHPIHKSSGKKVGLGIEFGYGLSPSRTQGDHSIASSMEMQLVVSNVSDFIAGGSGSSSVKSSYTTAKIRRGAGPITPPNGGTPYPDVRI
jgi:hypothetical protein